MKRTLIFALLILSETAFAVVCKTVGPEGVSSFTNVPGTECPAGSVATEYGIPGRGAERIQAVETGISGREIASERYRTIAISEPPADGIVRSNTGQFTVSVALQPVLQAGHFITVSIDKKGFRGRYGRTDIDVSGVEPGTHDISAAVFDSKGQLLIESATHRFTLQRAPSRIRLEGVKGDKVWGSFDGSNVEGSRVTIRLTPGGTGYEATVQRNGTWVVTIPSSILKTAQSLDISVRTGGLEFKAREDIRSVDYSNAPPPDYTAPPADYTPPASGISITPGQTNPAFSPKYRP
jgi:hypothetical protein